MNRVTRQALSLLRKARCAETLPKMLIQIERACALMAPQKKSDKIKAYGRAARAEKQSKQKSRKEKSRELHDKVMRRPGWACELGEHESMSLLSFIQVHHLKAGSAKRHTEALHNLIRACDVDHRLWHSKGPEFYRAAVERWCEVHGYPMPSVYTRRAA